MARSTALRRSRLRRARNHIQAKGAHVRIVIAGLALGFGIALLLVAGSTIGAAVGIYSHYTKELVAPETVLAGQARVGSRIYDRNGKLLYEYTDEEGGVRRPVLLNDVSPEVIKATVCTEDPTFYSNPGISARGLLRASYENLAPSDGESRFQGSGGSSITQQLAKITFIPLEERAERSPERKLKEIVLALEFTRRFSKDQILEWYLNNIFYGNNSIGIGAAANRFFGKSAAELNLAEATLLAGFPQSPGRYDPYGNWDEAKLRQWDVLTVMVDHGCLTEEELEATLATPIELAPKSFPVEAPHFVFGYMQPQLEGWFGKDTLYRSGLQITTSLDLDLQKEVEGILDEEITRVERLCGCHNGAVAVIKPSTGEVLAYVASRNYWNEAIQGKVDNLQSIKQPGSSFKPIVYLSYFMSQHAGPGSMIWITPYNKPANPATGEEAVEIVDPRPIPPGPVSIRYALGSSLNIPAVRSVELMGIEQVIRTANKLGYTTMGPEDLKVRRYGPAIATGGANLNLLEHTFAFATIANNGEMRGQRAVRNYGEGMRKIDPATILQVNTERNNLVYQFDNSVREQVVSANYSYLVTSIMSDCNARYIIWTCGTFDIGRPYAVKTGTQQGLQKDRQGRDTVLYNWQMGFTPDIAVGVWIGNQDNTPVNGANFETANAANAVWKRTMQAALRNVPPRPFEEPSGIERGRTLIGRPGSFDCSSTYDEVWAAGDVKSTQEQCNLINRQRPSGAPSVAPTATPRPQGQGTQNPTPVPTPPANTTNQGPPQVALPSQPAPISAPLAGSVPAIGQPVAAPPLTAPTPVTLVATGQQPAPPR